MPTDRSNVGKPYKCAECGEEFESGWSDEGAEAELNATFPGVDKGICDIGCDDCYRKIINPIYG